MRKRLLTFFWLACFGLIAYGSLMPFDYCNDPTVVAFHGWRAWQCWPLVPHGAISRTDLVSNLLLYIPLGLLGTTRLRFARSRGAGGSHSQYVGILLAFLAATVAGSVLSATVETAQMYSFTRVTSAQDWLANTIGTMAGALVGATVGPSIWLSLLRSIRLRIIQRPVSLVGLIMIAMLALDALYPLLPTLDVSTVKQHVKATLQYMNNPLAGHTWHHWLVCRVGIYAVLAAVLAGASRRAGWRRYAMGIMLALLFATGMELAKTFIDQRWTDPGNVIMSLVGVLVGAILAAALAGRLSTRTQALLAAALAFVYLAYQELVPIPGGLLGVEVFRWDISQLPLYSYMMSADLHAVVLFFRNIILAGAVTFALGMAGSWAGASPAAKACRMGLLMALAATAMEFAQFIIPGRIPSTTDIFCLAVGGALGGYAHASRLLGARIDSTPCTA